MTFRSRHGQPWLRSPRFPRMTLLVALAIALFFLTSLIPHRSVAAPSDSTKAAQISQTLASQDSLSLPPPRSHPLPPTLAQWQDPNQTGDYFDQIQSVSVGYLIWFQFPVTVYIEPPQPAEQANPFSAKQAAQWIAEVQAAVQDWNAYLPLTQVDQAKDADIAIWRKAPPLRVTPETGTGSDRRATPPQIRARSALTTFEFYAKPLADPSAALLLAHRFTILLRPDQAKGYIEAAARHELGHALGIWGHSPLPTDALYFSQVRTPPPISTRDINTLKQIYQQPTQLGWMLGSRSGDR